MGIGVAVGGGVGGTGVLVGVGLGVAVGGTGVAVACGLDSFVGVGVAVGGIVCVGVGVDVGVAVGVGVRVANCCILKSSAVFNSKASGGTKGIYPGASFKSFCISKICKPTSAVTILPAGMPALGFFPTNVTFLWNIAPEKGTSAS